MWQNVAHELTREREVLRALLRRSRDVIPPHTDATLGPDDCEACTLRREIDSALNAAQARGEGRQA